MTNEEWREGVLDNIIEAYDTQELRKMEERGSGIVHYTSAANSINVIRGGAIWMRNARLMNDFSEIDYGRWCVNGALDTLGGEWVTTLDSIHPGLAYRVKELYDGLESHRASNTYILSLSEHLKSEDDTGRLSMWRAYGGEAGGVALVFTLDTFSQDVEGLNIYATVVRYTDQAGFTDHLRAIMKHIASEILALQGFDPAYLAQRLALFLHFSVLSTKHPAFSEEREIRLLTGVEPSAIAAASVEVVGGIPQIVWKIPLKNDLQSGYKAALPQILQRVIIGPVPSPLIVNEAIRAELKSKDVWTADQIVHTSWVPLRRSL